VGSPRRRIQLRKIMDVSASTFRLAEAIAFRVDAPRKIERDFMEPTNDRD
jgi:hypothetical protein